MSADAVATSGVTVDQVIRPGSAPRPAGFVSSIGAHGWRAMLKIKHVPFQLFDVTVMPIMFTLLFTYIFGGALAGTPKEYIQYLAPGIIVQTVVFITVYTGVGLNTDIKKGLHDRFRSLPNWQPSPVFGMLAGDLFRYTVASVVVLVVAMLIGYRPGSWLGVGYTLALVLFFCQSLSWLWIIVGMKAKTPESVMTTSFIFLMPLTFASDIFVSLDTMPDWLQTIVGNNPVSHLAAAARDMMGGVMPGDDLWWVLGSGGLLTLVFAPLAMRMYRAER
ncbi:MAG: ABC transporter permease [Thermoplasmatota archaeon]